MASPRGARYGAGAERAHARDAAVRNRRQVGLNGVVRDAPDSVCADIKADLSIKPE